MDVFRTLFGGGAAPPSWARALGDCDRFALFVEAVRRFLALDGHDVADADIASGKVALGEREWILDRAAERCAATDPSTWEDVLVDDYVASDAREVPVRTRILVHLVRGELDEVDRLASEAIAAGDGDPSELHVQRALAALMRGDEEVAIRELEQADAGHFEARLNLAQLLAARGDARAREIARQALALRPGDAAAARGAALAHLVLGDVEAARALLGERGGLADDEAAALYEQTIAGRRQR